MSSDYWCCIVTRDGADTIGRTIDSIISQTLPPKFVTVVNDGSTDNTVGIVKDRLRSFPSIYLLDTGSRTRDIRKVPRLLNQGLNFVLNGSNELPGTHYMMVSGDDNELSSNYAERILQRMEEDPKLVVASGDWITSRGRTGEQMPHGGGRFVKMSFMKKIGGRYPVAYGWETWLLYKAQELGYRVRIFPDIRYKHLRPFHPKNLLGWGRAMYSLGFPFYFVALRFAINFFWSGRGTQSRQASISMLVGYLSARLDPRPLRGLLIQDDALKTFVKHACATRLTRLL
jgi:glycosyltransferase involved in cell wall biosynthesis